MTSDLTYQANLARLDDLRRRAHRRRAGTETPVRASAAIAIRRATEADRTAVERLAALDSAPAPSGEVLIAAVGGEPQAAVEIASDATIADPFRPTAHALELLTVRAARLRGVAKSPRRLRLRSRSAYGAA